MTKAPAVALHSGPSEGPQHHWRRTVDWVIAVNKVVPPKIITIKPEGDYIAHK